MVNKYLKNNLFIIKYMMETEDFYLNEKYFKNKKNGVFVEVGALDGVNYSTTKYFEDNFNWSGLLIEPNPVQFELLKKNRPNCNMSNSLVSDLTESLEYKYFLTSYAAVSGVVATLPKKHFEDYFNNDNDWIKEHVQTSSFITPVPLRELVKDYKYIDLLTIDVEGHELNVLNSFDFSIPVYLIMVDNNEKNKEVRELMEKNGYIFMETYKDNEIYVNRSIQLEILSKPLYEADYDIIYNVGDVMIMPVIGMLLDENFRSACRLSEEWVKKGKRVAICGKFNEEIVINDVPYLNWSKLSKTKLVDTLICWRSSGIKSLLNGEFMTNNLLIDFHDNFPQSLEDINEEELKQLFNTVKYFYFKSEFHKKCFNENYKYDENKYRVVLNGVEDLYKPSNNIRQPFRFCYYASYHKGLDILLEKIWSHIYANEPQAELHVYGGMDNIMDDTYKIKLRLLLGLPGVMDHGRQPLSLVAREKHMSSFHFHLNNLYEEVDALTIRESLKAGCIPLISKAGVFLERHGLQFDWDPNSDELCKLIAQDILQKMHDFEFVDKAREQIMSSNMTDNWETISEKWLN